MFTLSGTIKEKGVEYLVKRSWLFGISVVNKKPRIGGIRREKNKKETAQKR